MELTFEEFLQRIHPATFSLYSSEYFFVGAIDIEDIYPIVENLERILQKLVIRKAVY
jgi:hypothetical protein